MIIEVTQEDIDKAEAGCSGCPIARAVKRALKLESGVNVYARSTHVLNVVYPNTDAMERFILAFDNDERVRPKKFEVHWGEKIK